MKTYAPEYYKDFKCIADKCKHSCCIGWEIDIDETTYEIYKKAEGDFSDCLKRNISFEGDTPHFLLDENERCPFLNEKGLCDIIINLGEEMLCDICSDHPRFRNYIGSREEIGLGLCCEAAVELILCYKDKFNIVEIADDGFAEESEEENIEIFLSTRQKIFDIVQDENEAFEKRLCRVFKFANINSSEILNISLCDIFSKLEYMEKDIPMMLEKLKTKDVSQVKLSDNFSLYFEKLMIYFLFRYLPRCIFENDIKEIISFSVVNIMMIAELSKLIISEKGDLHFDDFSEILRMYSAEIEYSEENIESIIDYISEFEL